MAGRPTGRPAPDGKDHRAPRRAALTVAAVAAVAALLAPATAASAGPGSGTPEHSTSRIALPAGTAGQAHDLAVDPRTHTAYVADRGELVAVDEISGTASAYDVGLPPDGSLDLVAVDSALGEVFVVVDDAHGTYQIKALAGPSHSTIATIAVPGSVRAMTVDEWSHTLIAVGEGGWDYAGGDAIFIDERLNEIRGSTRVGIQPSAVAVDDQRDIAYVADTIGDTVSVLDIDGMAVGTTIAVGEQPAGIAVDSASHTVFVTNWLSDSVSMIVSTLDPTGGPAEYSVVKTISVAGDPWGVAVDSSTHLVYVAPEDGHMATLLDGIGGDISETVPTAAGNPFRVAVDDALDTAFVIDQFDPTLTRISPAP